MKHITLIITGSIGASKALLLYEKLITTYIVDVIATPATLKFLPANNIKISSELFEKDYYDKNDEIVHTRIALKTDLIVTFPATMNFVSKASLAIADNLALAIFLASPACKLIFLAMNHYMYHNQSFQNNCSSLQKLNNVKIIKPNKGMLACKIVGDGRLKEVEEAFKIINDYFENLTNSSLNNKRVLINYGATRTYFDPVVYLSNNSSGKMGFALQEAFNNHNAKVTSIVANINDELKNRINNEYITADTNEEMLLAMEKYYDNADLVICVAAVNDFSFTNFSPTKVRKVENTNMSLSLTANVDILKKLGSKKSKQILIGFSAQDDIFDEKTALLKLKAKNCDGIIANSYKVMNQEHNEVIFYYQNQKYHFSGSKQEVANSIVKIFSE